MAQREKRMIDNVDKVASAASESLSLMRDLAKEERILITNAIDVMERGFADKRLEDRVGYALGVMVSLMVLVIGCILASTNSAGVSYTTAISLSAVTMTLGTGIGRFYYLRFHKLFLYWKSNNAETAVAAV